MSLSIDGFWKAGFWSTTFWADGFWYEGDPAPPPATTSTGGGGKSKRYPRRVMLRGRLYTVRNPREERELLQAALDRAKTLAAIAEPQEAADAKRTALRFAKRTKAVEREESQWLARLRQIDEELLLLL